MAYKITRVDIPKQAHSCIPSKAMIVAEQLHDGDFVTCSECGIRWFVYSTLLFGLIWKQEEVDSGLPS